MSLDGNGFYQIVNNGNAPITKLRTPASGTTKLMDNDAPLNIEHGGSKEDTKSNIHIGTNHWS